MDNAFDRVNFGLRERPLSGDFNRAEAQVDRSLRDVLRSIFGARTQASGGALVSYSGLIGDGLRVVPTSPAALSVQVSPGIGFLASPLDLPSDIGAPDLESVDDLSPFKPVVLNAPAIFPVTPPGIGLERIDIIEVKVDRRLDDSVTRRQLNLATEAFEDHSFYKTLTFVLDGRTGTVSSPSDSTAGLSYKIGAAAVAPVAPSTTAGYVKLAEIRTANGIATVTASAISDMRPLLHPGGMAHASIRYRLQWNAGAPVITVLHVAAPAGIEIGARAVVVKGNSEVYAIGGNILRAVAQVTIEHPTAMFGGATHITPRVYPGGVGILGNSHLVRVIEPGGVAEQNALAAASPALMTGRAAQRVAVALDTVYSDGNGTADITNVALEDLVFNLSFALSYQ